MTRSCLRVSKQQARSTHISVTVHSGLRRGVTGTWDFFNGFSPEWLLPKNDFSPKDGVSPENGFLQKNLTFLLDLVFSCCVVFTTFLYNMYYLVQGCPNSRPGRHTYQWQCNYPSVLPRSDILGIDWDKARSELQCCLQAPAGNTNPSGGKRLKLQLQPLSL